MFASCGNMSYVQKQSLYLYSTPVRSSGYGLRTLRILNCFCIDETSIPVENHEISTNTVETPPKAIVNVSVKVFVVLVSCPDFLMDDSCSKRIDALRETRHGNLYSVHAIFSFQIKCRNP